MFETLRAYFKFELTDEQYDLITRLFIPKHFKKGEIFLREGEKAKHAAFVVKGCMRSFVIDNKGKERIIQFAPENWWITDTNSLINNEPSMYSIDAIEPSDVLLLDAPSQLLLMEKIPAYGSSFHAGRQRHTASKEKRIISTLTSSAEERYSDFLKTYPSIAQRVPQHMLASYLGISPETLSRIRKSRTLKK